MDKKQWVLKHPDFESYWGWADGDDFDLVVDWVPLSFSQMIESKYKPTYLNFVGSNVKGNLSKMKKGEVVELSYE